MLDPEVLPAIQTTRRQLQTQTRAISTHVNDLRNLLSVFEEFDIDYWAAARDWAHRWVQQNIVLATRLFREAEARNPGFGPSNAQRVYHQLYLLQAALQYITQIPRP